PAASSSFAFLSKSCAVKIPDSNSTICCCCTVVGSVAACAWPLVASIDCCVRLGSRPSHMMVVRKPRFVDGSGRRYTDTIPVVGTDGPKLVRPVTGLVLHP